MSDEDNDDNTDDNVVSFFAKREANNACKHPTDGDDLQFFEDLVSDHPISFPSDEDVEGMYNVIRFLQDRCKFEKFNIALDVDQLKITTRGRVPSKHIDDYTLVEEAEALDKITTGLLFTQRDETSNDINFNTIKYMLELIENANSTNEDDNDS